MTSKILITEEHKRLIFLKTKAKENRLRICKERDVDYDHVEVNANYKLSKFDMLRPLTDFLNTDDCIKYIQLKEKISCKHLRS